MTAEVPDDRRERIASDPFCESLGIELVTLGPGVAVTRLVVTEALLNFHGTPHGGAVYSLADAAFAAASNAGGETAVALETNISYLGTVDVGTTLTATAEETHRSRRTASYEVDVTADVPDGVTDDVTDDVADDVTAEPPDGDGRRVATFRGRVYRP